MNTIGHGRKRFWPNFMYCPGILCEGTEGKHQKAEGITEASTKIRNVNPSDSTQGRHYWGQVAAVTWRYVSYDHNTNHHNRHTLVSCNEIKNRCSKATGQHSFQRLAAVHS
jgi:hypothetical protein